MISSLLAKDKRLNTRDLESVGNLDNALHAKNWTRKKKETNS